MHTFETEGKSWKKLSLFMSTFDIMTKLVIYNDNLNWTNPKLKFRWNIGDIQENVAFNTSRNICCGYLLESPRWGVSIKYPQHTSLGEIKKTKPLFT